MVAISGVYVLINTVNHQIYVGSSVDIDRRWGEHLDELRRGVKTKRWQQDYAEHGEAAFLFQVLERCECVKRVLLAIGQYYLDTMQPFGDRGYNQSKKAGSNMGFRHTAESKKKIGDGSRGKKQAPEHKAKRAANTRVKLLGKNSLNPVRLGCVGKGHLLYKKQWRV